MSSSMRDPGDPYMRVEDDDNQAIADHKMFEDFLERDVDGKIAERIERMLEAAASSSSSNSGGGYGGGSENGSDHQDAAGSSNGQRLLINLDELRDFDIDVARRLLRNPIPLVVPFEDALNSYIDKNSSLFRDPKQRQQTDVSASSSSSASSSFPSSSGSFGRVLSSHFEDTDKYKLGFVGPFGAHLTTPRGLNSKFLSTLVCVEGIVTKMSLVRPKLKRSVHYCPKTGATMKREYRDATSLRGLPTSSVIPSKDDNENLLELEYGLSSYEDSQKIVIQEMPESAPLGQLPRSTDIILASDLVDRCKPGDRVRIAGIYRALSNSSSATGKSGGAKSTSGIFPTVVIANSVQTIGKEVNGLTLTETDLQNIMHAAHASTGQNQQHSNSSSSSASSSSPPNPHSIFRRIARSLAPSIYGHSIIKRAILLMLLGGMEKNLANGTHLRGDINILMVGDPSTAKSQLLRFVLGIAPLAVSTTGRGSTGVGLTAAVTSDPDTGDRRLEAGAMVLADRGVVCIDEFDKMGDADRVAIHEVMEQQTVTIAKAGMHASLNARCSVIAAANPIYGQYDKELSPQRNVGLPDSLLSRFDLLFIVLDELDPSHDRAISDHVLRMHRYQRPGSEGIPISLAECSGIFSHTNPQSGQANGDDKGDDGDDSSPMYQKFDPLLHGGYAAATEGDSAAQESGLFSTPFIRKYIHYAKSRIKPVLSSEACKLIAQEYASLRQEQATKTLPVTARQLETMIRLATAHAKIRLSGHVEKVDCEEALEVMRFALYGSTDEAEKVRQSQNGWKHGEDERELGDESENKDDQEDDSDSDSPNDNDDHDGTKSKVRKRRRDRKSKSSLKGKRGVLRAKNGPSSGKPTSKLTSTQRKQGKENGSQSSPSRKAKFAKTKKNKSKDMDSDDDEDADADDDEDEDEDDVDMAALMSRQKGKSTAVPVKVDKNSKRFMRFQQALTKLFQTRRAEVLETAEILSAVNKQLENDQDTGMAMGEGVYYEDEANAILAELEHENRVMHRDGNVFQI